MPKKRKAPRSFEQPQSTKSAKYDVEERFNDSEDEFFAGRDKILLDETADTKRRRRLIEQEKDLQPSDEEILAYQDEDEGISEDDNEDEYSEDESQDGGAKVKASKQRRDNEEEEEESEEEVWGTNRADYYGDDVIETEEQAREEEAEAKRLYQKQLKNMTEADFGFDENEWVEEKKDKKKSRSVTEKLPEAQIPEGATNQQKLDILKTRYPEFVPLAEDFGELQRTKLDLDKEVVRIAKSLEQGAQLGDGLPVTLKRGALSAYLGTVSMYFAVLSTAVGKDSNARKITALPPLELHEHAVIQSLARARELWDQVADADIAEPISLPSRDVQAVEATTLNGKHSSNTLSELKPVMDPVSNTASKKVKEKSKKSKDQTDPLASKKKRKSKSKDKVKPLEISDLMNGAASDTEASELGDEQPLTAEEYAEKARKRKSLRFYTSQIASKANRRGHASREAGGDDDLPYKERQRDKHERLLKEAEARGRAKPDEADNFGGDDYDDMPRKDQNDEYYDTLLNANSQKKADKQARAEAYKQAAAEGATVYEEEAVGADGKRAITYAIAKNKGLAPKRNKDVRNPRVKKRKKYDEKMKKLGSVRQVYKGGEGRGGYGGELTGIKTNVVKSIKL